MRVITVRETIHHGEYYNVRTMEIPATWDGFVSLLLSSPYAGGATVDTLARNEYVASAFASLIEHGTGEHGWAIYDVIES